MGLWGLLGDVISTHHVTFSITVYFSHQPSPRWSVFARLVWLLYHVVLFFFFFQLIQVWVNLTKWLPFERGWWPICHRTSFLCFYRTAESREGNKATQGWWRVIWSDFPHHKTSGFLEWCLRHLFPCILHLLFFRIFFSPTSCVCILFGFSSTQFTRFHWNPVAGLLSEAGWSFWVLYFVFSLVWFAWTFIGPRLFMHLIYWEGYYLRGICSSSICFRKKKFTLLST